MHTYANVCSWMCLSACVCLCVGAHTCLSAQRKWLTEKNVANSNFNCQWEKKRGVEGDSIFMGSVQMNRGDGFKHESVFLITIKKCFNMTATF